MTKTSCSHSCRVLKPKSDAVVLINLQAFTEILFGFDQSKILAKADGFDVEEYYVITNRHADTKINELWKNPTSTQFEKLLKARKKERVWPEWASKIIGKYGDERSAVSAWCEVLAKLKPVLHASYDHGFEQLKRFARRHGVLEGELDGALNAVVGQLLRETAQGSAVEITVEWLKRLLTGAFDALDMSFDASDQMLTAARELLNNRLHLLTGSKYPTLARRRFAKTLLDEVERHPVTFVCGGGGTGKSVLCLQHLLEYEKGPLGLSVNAADLTSDFLPEAVHRLRSRTPCASLPHDTIDQTVARLIGANGSKTTVLIIDIDAVDEAHPSLQGEIRKLVRLFMEHGEKSLAGKLLVSCRPKRKGRRLLHGLIRDWVKAEVPEACEGRIGVLEIGDFDEVELEEAESNLSEELESRLFRATPLETIESETTFDSSTPKLALRRSLCHPVVWGEYARLNPEARSKVRQGHRDGIDQLAEGLLERFLAKCLDRRIQSCQENRLQVALRRIATASSKTTPPFDRVGVWEVGANGILNSDETSFLYDESLTYGIIEEEEPTYRWRWRHDFLVSSLTRGAE